MHVQQDTLGSSSDSVCESHPSASVSFGAWTSFDSKITTFTLKMTNRKRGLFTFREIQNAMCHDWIPALFSYPF